MDKQMIEEMAKTLEFCCNDENIENCNSDMSCDYCRAKHLYNVGYRKIHENAVVLTRKEFEKHKGFSREEVDEISETAIKNSRKETAEKFAKESKQRLKGKLHRGKALHATVFGKEYMRRIFKEVIDEICKEITEGK